MKRRLLVVAAWGLLGIVAEVYAQQPIVYPAKGQSSAQQKTDEGACSVWARDNTGIDPAVLASQPAPQAEASTCTWRCC